MQADRLRYISVRNTIQTAKAGNKTSRGLSRKCNRYAITKHARVVWQGKKRKMEDELSLVWNGKTNMGAVTDCEFHRPVCSFRD